MYSNSLGPAPSKAAVSTIFNIFSMPQFKTRTLPIPSLPPPLLTLYRDNSRLSIYELRKTSYKDLDSCYTHDLSLIPNIIKVIYATCTMGAVRIVK